MAHPINDLRRKKNEVTKKLETLKIKHVEETKFSFLGNCGKPHTINTELLPEHGIAVGEFITTKSLPDQIYICVGNGERCSHSNCRENHHVLWFYNVNRKGVIYFDAMTFHELEAKEHACKV